MDSLAVFSAMQERIMNISHDVSPSVVHIESILKIENQNVLSTGSGILSDDKGHILTNQHVVEKAEKVTVTLPGQKKKLPAEIIGTDKQTDLAVLKIKATSKLQPAHFGDSSKVKVGDWVVAIGNPYGLDGTVSFGIVSAIQRNLNVGAVLNEFLQTDAMIDFGSSGGPLVNIRGEVIGVNSRGQGRGIGFTIPANTALDILKKLIAGGNVERAWLGVSIQPLDRDLAEYMKIPNVTGVILNQVHEGSTAEKAGLKPGDILTSFDGTPIEAETDADLPTVTRAISQTKVGKKVKMTVLRNGKTLKLEGEILRQPKIEGQEIEAQSLGFNAKEITKLLLISERLQSRKGVYVSFVEPGSIADEGKLQRGDIIQKIDQRDVDDLAAFRKVSGNLAKEKRALLQVLRGNDLVYVLLKNDRKRAFDSGPEAK